MFCEDAMFRDNGKDRDFVSSVWAFKGCRVHTEWTKVFPNCNIFSPLEEESFGK